MKLIIEIPDDKIAIEYGEVVSIGRNNDKELADYIFAGTPLTESDDCVSRQDVLGIINTHIGELISDIRDMSSVQPKVIESDDCVSRDAVIELVKKGEYDITGKTDNEMFLEEVNKLPSVQPK